MGFLRSRKRTDYGRYTSWKILFYLTFPDDDYPPSFGFQLFFDAGIPGDVAGELLLPELGIVLRIGEVAVRAAMPETTIDENRHLTTRIANVRMASDLPLKPITTFPRFTKRLPQNEFGFGILARIGTHGSGDPFVQRLGRIDHACRTAF